MSRTVPSFDWKATHQLLHLPKKGPTSGMFDFAVLLACFCSVIMESGQVFFLGYSDLLRARYIHNFIFNNHVYIHHIYICTHIRQFYSHTSYVSGTFSEIQHLFHFCEDSPICGDFPPSISTSPENRNEQLAVFHLFPR